MAGKTDRLALLYAFLETHQVEKSAFSLADVAVATGYAQASVRTYLSKKLHPFVSHQRSAGGLMYQVTTPLPTSREQFLAVMSQVDAAPPTTSANLWASLQERSRDAFTVAVESYNRPSLANRVEVFAILMANAWELLLKAEIIEASGELSSVYYPKVPERSLSLRDVVKKRFPKESDPVRKNIETLADLRDKAVHLLISELQPHLSRLFQSAVLNFIDRFRQDTGTDLFDGAGGMMSLIIDREAATIAAIKQRFGDKVAVEVEAFLQRFMAEEEEQATTKFAIPIDYRLVLTKANQDGDIVLTHGEGGRRAIAVIQTHDVDKTHPLRAMEVVVKVKERCPKAGFTEPKLRAVCWKEKIYESSGSKFYYLLQNPPTHRFSFGFVDWLVEKIEGDDQYLVKCWKSYRANGGK